MSERLKKILNLDSKSGAEYNSYLKKIESLRDEIADLKDEMAMFKVECFEMMVDSQELKQSEMIKIKQRITENRAKIKEKGKEQTQVERELKEWEKEHLEYEPLQPGEREDGRVDVRYLYEDNKIFEVENKESLENFSLEDFNFSTLEKIARLELAIKMLKDRLKNLGEKGLDKLLVGQEGNEAELLGIKQKIALIREKLKEKEKQLDETWIQYENNKGKVEDNQTLPSEGVVESGQLGEE